MNISIRKALFFILIFSYSYILMPNSFPGDAWTATGLGLFFAWLCHKTFAQQTFDLKVTRLDLQLFAGFCGVLFVCHWPVLFVPLGNDEPHHAERALWLLKAAVNWTLRSDLQPYDELRDDIWKLVSFRAMPAIELWRIAVIGFACFAGLIYFCHRKLRALKGTLLADLFVVVALGLFSVLMKRWLDNHPPLRTFVPFLSSAVFGLNDFAFRLSAILVTGLFLVWFTRKVNRHLDLPSSVALALLVVLPPSIFHTTILLEPSIYGLFGWSMVLIALYEAFADRDDEKIVDALLLVPFFFLTRLPVILLALPVGVALLLRWRMINRRVWLHIATGLVLAVGYMVSIAGQWNSAGNIPVWENIYWIAVDGGATVMWLRNWGAPWMLLFIAGLGFYAFKASRARFLVLFFPVLFFLYNLTVRPDLWGMGRYQTEFIGGFWALFVFFASFHLARLKRHAAILAVTVVTLGAFTLEQIHRITSDNYGSSAFRSFISGMSTFPYREAVEYVERHDADINFLILGGTPSEYETMLWFYGYPVQEARLWFLQMLEFRDLANKEMNPNIMNQYLKARSIKYLILQTGRRHERLLRPEKMRSLFEQIENGDPSPLKLSLATSYETTWGGILKVYKVLP